MAYWSAITTVNNWIKVLLLAFSCWWEKECIKIRKKTLQFWPAVLVVPSLCRKSLHNRNSRIHFIIIIGIILSVNSFIYSVRVCIVRNLVMLKSLRVTNRTKLLLNWLRLSELTSTDYTCWIRCFLIFICLTLNHLKNPLFREFVMLKTLFLYFVRFNL